MASGASEQQRPVFHRGELEAQARWGTAGVWDAKRIERLIWDAIPDEHLCRVESFPFLFLATSDAEGRCDCSFKGGRDGQPVLRVLDPRRIAFPDYSGNGAFMSLGNILANPHVGILLIDFADGARLRIEGTAEVHDRGAAMSHFPDADRVVVVSITRLVPNCRQFVPRLVPDASGAADHAGA